MSNKIKREIIIKCSEEKDQLAIGNAIHEQLRGNPDYIENRIVLNIETENIVRVLVCDDAAPVDIVV